MWKRIFKENNKMNLQEEWIKMINIEFRSERVIQYIDEWIISNGISDVLKKDIIYELPEELFKIKL
jgi:hypothetical protein